MSQPITIAVAQSVVTADIAANGRHIRDLITRAAAAGARLVLFTEGAMSGYVKSTIRDWADVDWALLRAELDETAALCGRLGIWAVIGSAHSLSPPNRPHNSLYVISDQGQLAGRYDKRYLSHTEITDWFSPGFEPLTFDVDGFRFGLALCIEVCFPELFAEYEALGVDCVLLASYGLEAERRVQAQAHAATNCFWLATSVPAEHGARGPSGLVGPDGSLLASAQADAMADLAVYTLDRAAPEFDIALTKARPWRRLAREGQIYRDKAVDDPRSADRLAF